MCSCLYGGPNGGRHQQRCFHGCRCSDMLLCSACSTTVYTLCAITFAFQELTGSSGGVPRPVRPQPPVTQQRRSGNGSINSSLLIAGGAIQVGAGTLSMDGPPVLMHQMGNGLDLVPEVSERLHLVSDKLQRLPGQGGGASGPTPALPADCATIDGPIVQ